MKSFLTLDLLAFLLTLAVIVAARASVPAESSFELTCRAKAKEIAADTYRNCVTENRNAEVDRLKKDYKERLRALKDDYEKEIDNLGAKKSTKKSETSAVAPSTAKNQATKPAPQMADESQMDLPEPVPVENVIRN